MESTTNSNGRDGRRAAAFLQALWLTALIPDIAERDVFVCGPASMTAAAGAALRAAGARRIVTEGFGR